MRVISGSARGRKLAEPKDMAVRPTTDKVKESIFNIIQFDIPGRQILDMFSGTGQLGIEALSRGAEKAVFMDNSRDSIALCRQNVKTCGFEKQSVIVQGDSISLMEHSGKFDVIFMDPPYQSSLLDDGLKSIVSFDILKVNGIIICESLVEKELPELSAPYRKLREYRYGKIKITTYTRDLD